MKKLIVSFLVILGIVFSFAADGFDAGVSYFNQNPEYVDLYDNPANSNFGFLLEFTGDYNTSSSLTYSNAFTFAPFDGTVAFALIDTVAFTTDSVSHLVDTTFTPKIAYSFQVHEGDDDNSFDNNPTFKIYGCFEPQSNYASEVATLGTASDTTKNNGEVQIFFPVHYPYYFVTINASGEVDSDADNSFEVQLYPYHIDE